MASKVESAPGLNIGDLALIARNHIKIANSEGWSQHDMTRKLAEMALVAVTTISELRVQVSRLEHGLVASPDDAAGVPVKFIPILMMALQDRRDSLAYYAIDGDVGTQLRDVKEVIAWLARQTETTNGE